MIKFIVSLILNAFVLMLIGFLFEGIQLSGYGAAFIASFILAILNVTIRPILILLTLPATILTLGLFLLVINGVTLSIASWLMGDAFVITSFGLALLASIILTIFQTLLINPIQSNRS
ncbi:phage holin family protein [Alkalicoccobacillus porphyridii]|uniref:Phage holin family protein n=1 Tax=Alkalicoccobacillus porphyridii TaxID=2597270 RepID=A0A554A3M8_9BACI|nr:phage holin family protein [Alkalicoccobacillus porphyridii]TSB48301.1 phage holin family protein [Alkalicoccobacillus porphyridii]